MDALLWLLTLAAGPDLSRLGADDWDVREAETTRCDNALSALLLPAWHPDPEVNYRVRTLRARNLRWIDPVYVERLAIRNEFHLWLRLYLAADRSAFEPRSIFDDIHAHPLKATALFRMWPVRPGTSESFLFGSVVEGEYERWLDHCDYHLHRAPAPREADTTPSGR